MGKWTDTKILDDSPLGPCIEYRKLKEQNMVWADEDKMCINAHKNFEINKGKLGGRRKRTRRTKRKSKRKSRNNRRKSQRRRRSRR